MDFLLDVRPSVHARVPQLCASPLHCAIRAFLFLVRLTAPARDAYHKPGEIGFAGVANQQTLVRPLYLC